MRLAFDEVKATQTAALLLSLSGGSLNHLALIKLLYKADREALRRWGLPITTDNYASMKNGIVTSRIYDLIKASADPHSHPTFWSSHIVRPSNIEVRLGNDPGKSELSPAEEALLEEIFKVDGAKDRFDLADEHHTFFPEWKDPGASSFPLEIDEIVEALGLSEEEATKVESLIGIQRAASKLSVL
jgi:hypothetical protein